MVIKLAMTLNLCYRSLKRTKRCESMKVRSFVASASKPLRQ